ncbi:MAG: DMT family transporter [Bacteroidia bacterium]|nr:DMT family transporter [Bacteroidia bacterium]
MNQTIGIIAALITLTGWTIGTFSFTKAAKLYAPVSVNRVRLLYACILLSFISCAVVWINPIQLFTSPLLMHWVWLGVSGIIGLSIGDHFAFTAFKILGSSRTSLFNSFAPAAALIGGVLMLGETMNLIGVLGMLISIIGIAWFIKSNAHNNEVLDKKQVTKGILFAILGAVCQGVGLVFAKKGLVLLNANDQLISPIHATWIRLFVGTVFIYAMGIFKTNVWKELKEISITKVYFKPIIIGTVFGPVMGVSMSLIAASNMDVSLAQTIFSFLPITVILSAHFMGKEKIKLESIFAALLSLVGVFVLVNR